MGVDQMAKHSIKSVGNVTFFCNEKLWGALDNIHREYGINKSDIITAFIERHFKTEQDLMVGLYDEVELNLMQRLQEIRKAKANISEPVVKDKPVIVNINKYEPKTEFGSKLAEVVKDIELDKTPATNDIVYDNFRFARYSQLESIGMQLQGSEFLNKAFWSKKWKNTFFKMQATQALDMWRDGKTINDIIHAQPIFFVDEQGKKCSRNPTVQTMFKRLIKVITKHGTGEEKQTLYGYRF